MTLAQATFRGVAGRKAILSSQRDKAEAATRAVEEAKRTLQRAEIDEPQPQPQPLTLTLTLTLTQATRTLQRAEAEAEAAVVAEATAMAIAADAGMVGRGGARARCGTCTRRRRGCISPNTLYPAFKIRFCTARNATPATYAAAAHRIKRRRHGRKQGAPLRSLDAARPARVLCVPLSLSISAILPSSNVEMGPLIDPKDVGTYLSNTSGLPRAAAHWHVAVGCDADVLAAPVMAG